mmetsp:Transcript_25492/g.31850  ORF Transcript_25492/g.31850 Transcript_25492/m.31850 type:complete len:132 (+) Transcript_25492:921-1316(+)
MREFKRTSIAAEFVPEPSAHATLPFSFSDDPKLGTTQPAFIRMFLERDINLRKETLSITVHQQGERLRTYRLAGHQQKFEPAAFSIMLISDAGELIFANKALENFAPTLQPRDRTLRAGGEGYLIMIDSAW